MSVQPSFSRSAPLLALAASLIFLTAGPGESAEQTAAGVSEGTKAQTTTHRNGIIAVPDIATRAMEVAALIRDSNAKLASGAGIKAISESLPNAAKLIDLKHR